MKFPVFIFRCPGGIVLAGNRYAFTLVNNEEELKERQAQGWKLTLEEAISDYKASGEKQDKKSSVKRKAKPPKKPSRPLDGVNHRLLVDDAPKVKIVEAVAHQIKEPYDELPPTREELEQMGKELGLKFDGRTSDKKLNRMIEEALQGA